MCIVGIFSPTIGVETKNHPPKKKKKLHNGLFQVNILLMCMWGQRIWQPRPISYQAQGPRRGGRNVGG